MLRRSVEDDKEILLDLAVARRIAQRESRSFIFSQELGELRARITARRQGSVLSGQTDCMYDACEDAIDALGFFGASELFVVASPLARPAGISAVPLIFDRYASEEAKPSGYMMLGMDTPASIPAKQLEAAKRAVARLNIVLRQIVPGLEIEVRELGGVVLDDENEGQCIWLLSRRGDAVQPLGCESEGIRKIISVLPVLALVYSRSSIAVAIDDLDSGIDEYLLGELARIIAEGGRGQLIFTSHSLRPLETLGGQAAAFACTDTDSCYVRKEGGGDRQSPQPVSEGASFSASLQQDLLPYQAMERLLTPCALPGKA